MPLTPWTIRRGVDRPPSRAIALRAGPLSLAFQPELAFVRHVLLGDHEVLRGIYVAVRDRSWGTVPPRPLRLDQTVGDEEFNITSNTSTGAARSTSPGAAGSRATARGPSRTGWRAAPARRSGATGSESVSSTPSPSVPATRAASCTRTGRRSTAPSPRRSPRTSRSSTSAPSGTNSPMGWRPRSGSRGMSSRWKTSATGPMPRSRPTARP
ncbi:MAG: hypothetical protein WKF75_17995 [Singulisphaera sp.]